MKFNYNVILYNLSKNSQKVSLNDTNMDTANSVSSEWKNGWQASQIWSEQKQGRDTRESLAMSGDCGWKFVQNDANVLHLNMQTHSVDWTLFTLKLCYLVENCENMYACMQYEFITGDTELLRHWGVQSNKSTPPPSPNSMSTATLFALWGYSCLPCS